MDLGWFGLVWPEEVVFHWFGLGWIGLDWFGWLVGWEVGWLVGLVWFGVVWFGSVWELLGVLLLVGLVLFGLVWVGECWCAAVGRFGLFGLVWEVGGVVLLVGLVWLPFLWESFGVGWLAWFGLGLVLCMFLPECVSDRPAVF